MTIKYNFARNTDTGELDFSERAMARAIAAMSSEPFLPRSAKIALGDDLARSMREIAERNPRWHLADPNERSRIYFAAEQQVARDRPKALEVYVKCRPVEDDDYRAEARVESDDERISAGSAPRF